MKEKKKQFVKDNEFLHCELLEPSFQTSAYEWIFFFIILTSNIWGNILFSKKLFYILLKFRIFFLFYLTHININELLHIKYYKLRYNLFSCIKVKYWEKYEKVSILALKLKAHFVVGVYIFCHFKNPNEF